MNIYTELKKFPTRLLDSLSPITITCIIIMGIYSFQLGFFLNLGLEQFHLFFLILPIGAGEMLKDALAVAFAPIVTLLVLLLFWPIILAIIVLIDIIRNIILEKTRIFYQIESATSKLNTLPKNFFDSITRKFRKLSTKLRRTEKIGLVLATVLTPELIFALIFSDIGFWGSVVVYCFILPILFLINSAYTVAFVVIDVMLDKSAAILSPLSKYSSYRSQSCYWFYLQFAYCPARNQRQLSTLLFSAHYILRPLLGQLI